MHTKGSMETLRRRYEGLQSRLGKVGLILQGTITERTIERTGIHARGERTTYGPYYQWTWKRDGKTVTVNLSASQAAVYQKAIDNHRKLEKLIREMRDLSLNICEATTKGVLKRTSKNKHSRRLS